MKKTNFTKLSFLFLTIILVLSITMPNNIGTKSIVSEKNILETGNTLLTAGVFTSADGIHTITVNTDGTVLYDSTYSLTFNQITTGNTLTGKLGTNKKSVTFYQLNNSTIVSGVAINYIHGGETIYLYDYTVFNLTQIPTPTTGNIEVWSNNQKVNAYSDLQSAVTAATTGDTIKITGDLTITGGAYIKGKNLTIDGNNHILNRATCSNGVFIVEEDATLTINNLTIDGGATNFEVDYENVTFKDYKIPLKEGSINNDPKQNLSAIITKGTLNGNGLKVNNNYTASKGGAINVVSGNINLNNSNFIHNYGNQHGGAIYIGSNMKLNHTTYPVKNVVISNCDFSKNYTGHGGAIYAYNTENIKISKSDFRENTGNGGKGGAICLATENTTNPIGEQLGIDFTHTEVDDCTFDGNWAGNDGFAIQSYDSDLYINNSQFKNNVGTHPTSSVGTVSIEAYRKSYRIYGSIENSLFESNVGPVSGIGDHSSLIDLDVSNTKFISNKGNESILLYSAVANFNNCSFLNENVIYTVFDARIYENHEIPPVLNITNTTIKDTLGPTDILIRKQKHNQELNTYVVNLNGTTTANVDVWDNNQLVVNSKHTGDITVDGTTTEEKVVISEQGKLDGTVSSNSETYSLVAIYPDSETNERHSAITYLEKNKTYTKAEIYLKTLIEKDGYAITFYTDNTYTTPWDYTVTDNLVVYGLWEEHNHTYTDTLIGHKTGIYKQCECGGLGEGIILTAPKELVTDGNEKSVIINNELGISKNDYNVIYQFKDTTGNWVNINNAPIKAGEYKAILTYQNETAELEYRITEKLVNPETYNNIMVICIIMLICIIPTVLVIKHFNQLRTNE